MPGRRYVALIAALLLSAACGGNDDRAVEAPKAGGTIAVTSQAFDDGGEIPEEFSCDGENMPPPLSWDKVDAVEYAITMVDPDADGFVHWILYDVPVEGDTSFTSEELVSAATPGENSLGETGYAGPCPPEGDDPHTYVITVYALNAEVHSRLDVGAGIDEFVDAIECCVAAEGTLTGTFGR